MWVGGAGGVGDGCVERHPLSTRGCSVHERGARTRMTEMYRACTDLCESLQTQLVTLALRFAVSRTLRKLYL